MTLITKIVKKNTLNLVFKMLIPVLFFSEVGIAKRGTRKGVSFQSALKSLKSGKLEKASKDFYILTKQQSAVEERLRANFYLGRSLMKMKMDQAAALRFLKVAKFGESKYLDKSLSLLFDLSERNDSESFLKFAIDKLNKQGSSKVNSQEFMFRRGQLLVKKGKYEEAENLLRRVKRKYTKYPQSQYLLGVALAEQEKVNKAIDVFESLLEFYKSKSVTDNNRNLATLALARTYYQKGVWSESEDYYSDIPKDSDYWPESIFEVSWANFRKGKFRQVLGNLSSIHSPFYQDHFFPESVLLRSLVYLSICRTKETKKTLDFFKEIYSPMRIKLVNYIDKTESYTKVYEDTKKLVLLMNSKNLSKKDHSKAKIPIPIIKELMKDHSLSVIFSYIKHLRSEKRQIKRRSSSWRRSNLGKEVASFIDKRIKFAKKSIGRKIQGHLVAKRKEFASYFRQIDFIKYEMRSTEKKTARLSLQREGNSKSKKRIRRKVDFDLDRSFYLSKGIEYWPFSGEYWLDEIGNYHFLGVSQCVNRTRIK